jgi:hypothetical protein
MIAHFALMGDLYQYDPYETEASLWNSYPWQLGADNGLDFKATVPDFTMAKTIWDIGGSDSSIGATGAELGNFSMFATLIVMDNFGNLGSDVGKIPTPFPYKLIGISSGSMISVTSVASLLVTDQDAENSTESPLIGINNGAVISVQSAATLLVTDQDEENSTESPLIGINNGAVISVQSALTLVTTEQGELSRAESPVIGIAAGTVLSISSTTT